MSVMSGLNRIDFVVPANSPYAQVERDAYITQLTSWGITNWQCYHYSDSLSGLGLWGYYAMGVLISTQGIVTVATVTCTGALHPPSGSNITANPDPGVGTAHTWATLGYPFGLRTSNGGSGGSAPAGNNNYYVWNIAGNSTAAVADFTTAVSSIAAALAGAIVSNVVVVRYFKYVDSISGAWQVSAVFFGAGAAEFGATTPAVMSNNNILYMVTCAGTPNPPSGSPHPAVACPAFTQTPMVTVTAPLSFGPMR